MKIRKSFLTAAVAALAVAPTAVAQAAGPSAHAARLTNKIVLFKSIGGIKIGMTPKQVRRRLGKPSHTNRAGVILDYEYENRQGFGTMDVTFTRTHVTNVQTFLRSQRTPQGIHIGSTVKALKRAYRGRLKHAIGGFVVSNAADSAQTQFIIGGGKVTSIAIFTI